VNALNAFVSWAISFMNQLLQSILAPIVKPVQDGIVGYCGGIFDSTKGIESSVQGSGTASKESKNGLLNAFDADFFLIILTVVTLISIVLLALQAITGGVGFLISILVGVIVGYVVSTMIQAIAQAMYSGGLPAPTPQAATAKTIEILGNKAPSSGSIGAAALTTCIDVFGTLIGSFIFTFKGINQMKELAWLALSICCLCVGWKATIFNSPLLDWVVIGASFLVLAHSFVDAIKANDPNIRIVSGITAVAGAVILGISIYAAMAL